MNKPNPAPWEYEDVQNREERSAYGVVKDANGKILFDSLNSDVAEIHEDGDEDGYSRWDEAGRVNLTLAASAPDLLAVVEFALAKFCDPLNCDDDPAAAKLKEIGEAAVAKAKGS